MLAKIPEALWIGHMKPDLILQNNDYSIFKDVFIRFANDMKPGAVLVDLHPDKVYTTDYRIIKIPSKIKQIQELMMTHESTIRHIEGDKEFCSVGEGNCQAIVNVGHAISVFEKTKKSIPGLNCIFSFWDSDIDEITKLENFDDFNIFCGHPYPRARENFEEIRLKTIEYIDKHGSIKDHHHDLTNGPFYYKIRNYTGKFMVHDKGNSHINDHFYAFRGKTQTLTLIDQKELDRLLQEHTQRRVAGYGGDGPKGDNYIALDNEIQGQNFHDYVRLKIVRGILIISKTGSDIKQGQLKIIPWVDFNQEWTEEKVGKLLGFSQENIDFINEIIPNFYD